MKWTPFVEESCAFEGDRCQMGMTWTTPRRRWTPKAFHRFGVGLDLPLPTPRRASAKSVSETRKSSENAGHRPCRVPKKAYLFQAFSKHSHFLFTQNWSFRHHQGTEKALLSDPFLCKCPWSPAKQPNHCFIQAHSPSNWPNLHTSNTRQHVSKLILWSRVSSCSITVYLSLNLTAKHQTQGQSPGCHRRKWSLWTEYILSPLEQHRILLFLPAVVHVFRKNFNNFIFLSCFSG